LKRAVHKPAGVFAAYAGSCGTDFKETARLKGEALMIVDHDRLKALLEKPGERGDSGELRREGNVFFVGGLLPVRETLETLFDSHCQSPGELFVLTFGGPDHFHGGEQLARQVKRNFNSHLLGRMGFPPPPAAIERAYAAGVDFIDIPLRVFDRGGAKERGIQREEVMVSLENALGLFPRWSVATTLFAGEEPSCSIREGIDFLLEMGILPLVEISPRAAHYPLEEIAATFRYLAAGWKKSRAVIKPLQPLIGLTTPIVDARPRGILRGFIDRVQERRLLAASDLRRSLRVRRVEESFESAGL
jgi:hypothetical protein